MRKAYLCGDCSVDAVNAGGEDVGGTIGYGTSCETPAHRDLIAATHVVMVKGTPPPPPTQPAPSSSSSSSSSRDTTPIAVGPLTQLSAQLLAAWSQGDMTKADPNAVSYAVKAARQLMNETGGR